MMQEETKQPEKMRTPLFYGYIIVALIFIIQMIMAGSSVTFGVFFKPMINEFGWSRALISGAVSFSRILSGFSSIVMGGLNDRIGPRAVITLCGFLLGSGLLLMSLTNTVWQLYLFYILMVGLGMGGVVAPQFSTVARWFTRRRNLMTGIIFAGGSLGALILTPVANWLISTTGWRNSFVVLGAVALVIIVLCAQFLKGHPGKIGQIPYDAVTKPEEQEHKPNLNVGEFTLKEAIYTRPFWIVIIMAFCNSFCLGTIMVHIVPHATDLGISAAAAANILAVLSAGLLTGSLVMGINADRIGVLKAFVICFIPMLAVLFLLLPLTEAWMIGLLMFIMAWGNGGGSALVSNMYAELFGMRSHGLIVGFNTLVSALGGAVGPFIAGYVFDKNGSYQWAFILCGALIAAGIAIAPLMRPITQKDNGIASRI